ncbi:hypothetical protein Phi13:1_gp045 [Cellulophaga phage phi13:1]|uniref:Uncharacterized protein n=1 Tax=Cellulophaga phage phi13:1 TaxID=1327992 RepID=S0A126_9CAUD|nr:hypothetical protein Phi13:1_gp045 [Cellulophaga phage phi13:1]
MGLGTATGGEGLYLSIAGGFIWNRKAEKSDPNYATQEYEKADKSKGVRSGAKYSDLTGKIVGVTFRTHPEFGENINVTVDSEGERYIVSVSTNNRYSQSIMRALLNLDLTKEMNMRPYDFEGNDKKRAMGVIFKQDGNKVSLEVKNAPTKDADWFKKANKKDIKRFFEDLSDWYVAEVEEKVISQMDADLPKLEKKAEKVKVAKSTEEVEEAEEVEKVKKDIPKLTPLKMKKFISNYIEENYPDETLPSLSKDEILKWYELCVSFEELPFESESKMAEDDAEEEEADDAEMSEDDLQAKLDELI